MKKQEQILKTYRRNHEDGDFEEREPAKIVREKAAVKRIERQTERLLERMEPETDAEELLEQVAELSQQAKKTAGNARTHSQRLKELEKNQTSE